ncbi:MAG: helix-turn-helix domain-containing protein [Bdellovibrionaceae bacterium]|nr:helix-turn-helix domain-containing protein [Pseudobdellovibrionaceae bacterium]
MKSSINYKVKLVNGDSTLGMIKEPISSLKFEWLDSNTAAKYLYISVKTLRNLTSNGQIPFYKFGRRNRYRKDELDSILLKNKRGQNGN